MHKILVSSYSGEIKTLDFDPEAGTLTISGTTKTGPAASWMGLHPSDPSLLFLTNEVTDGRVQVYKVSSESSDGTLKLELLGERSSSGADPASFALTEKAIIIGNVSLPPSNFRYQLCLMSHAHALFPSYWPLCPTIPLIHSIQVET